MRKLAPCGRSNTRNQGRVRPNPDALRSTASKRRVASAPAMALLEVASCGCVLASSIPLNGSVSERSQNSIDSRLITSPLRLEPLKHVLIDAQ